MSDLDHDIEIACPSCDFINTLPCPHCSPNPVASFKCGGCGLEYDLITPPETIN